MVRRINKTLVKNQNLYIIMQFMYNILEYEYSTNIEQQQQQRKRVARNL